MESWTPPPLHWANKSGWTKTWSSPFTERNLWCSGSGPTFLHVSRISPPLQHLLRKCRFLLIQVWWERRNISNMQAGVSRGTRLKTAELWKKINLENEFWYVYLKSGLFKLYDCCNATTKKLKHAIFLSIKAFFSPPDHKNATISLKTTCGRSGNMRPRFLSSSLFLLRPSAEPEEMRSGYIRVSYGGCPHSCRESVSFFSAAESRTVYFTGEALPVRISRWLVSIRAFWGCCFFKHAARLHWTR